MLYGLLVSLDKHLGVFRVGVGEMCKLVMDNFAMAVAGLEAKEDCGE